MIRFYFYFVLALLFLSVFSIPLYSTSSTAPQEKFTISPAATVDFGTYPANEEKRLTFILKNTSTEKMTLGKIRTTCDCSAAAISKKILALGESTQITGIIHAESVMGPYAKNIYIESDAALGKNIKLTLKGNAVALLKVEPSNFIYMGALKAGSKSVWEFKISCSNPETELALPVLPENAPYSLKLERFQGYYQLTVDVQAGAPSDFFSVEFQRSVAKPDGWKPVQFKLAGRIVKE